MRRGGESANSIPVAFAWVPNRVGKVARPGFVCQDFRGVFVFARLDRRRIPILRAYPSRPEMAGRVMGTSPRSFDARRGSAPSGKLPAAHGRKLGGEHDEEEGGSAFLV